MSLRKSSKNRRLMMFFWTFLVALGIFQIFVAIEVHKESSQEYRDELFQAILQQATDDVGYFRDSEGLLWACSGVSHKGAVTMEVEGPSAVVCEKIEELKNPQRLDYD